MTICCNLGERRAAFCSLWVRMESFVKSVGYAFCIVGLGCGRLQRKGCESEFFFLVQWDSWHSSWVWTAAAAALEPTVDESGDALLPEGEAADKHGALGAADGGKGAAGGAGEIVGPIKLPWAAGGPGGAVGAGEIDGCLMLPSASGDGGDDGWAPWPCAGALEVSDGRPADVQLPAPPMGLRPQPESETPELLLAGVFPENNGERTQ